MTFILTLNFFGHTLTLWIRSRMLKFLAKAACEIQIGWIINLSITKVNIYWSMQNYCFNSPPRHCQQTLSHRRRGVLNISIVDTPNQFLQVAYLTAIQ